MHMTILVGTIGQGVMRSTDSGETWDRVGVRRGIHAEALVRCMALHPRHPNIVFAGTERGLYRSDDAGNRWQRIDSPLNEYYVWSLTIDPEEPEVMFAGTGTPTPATIFRSTDGGKSWARRPVAVASECDNVGVPRVTAIAIDPVDRRKIWMGLEVDGVRRSTDRGDTWTMVDVAVHQGDVHNVIVTAGPPRTVFIVDNRDVHISTDDGATWKTMGLQKLIDWDVPRPHTYPRGIALQANDSRVLFLGIGDATPGSAGAILRSRDTGASWEMLSLPVRPNSTIWTFGMHRADGDIVFAASRFGYLYRSDRGGDGWTKLRREFSEIAAVRWIPN